MDVVLRDAEVLGLPLLVRDVSPVKRGIYCRYICLRQTGRSSQHFYSEHHFVYDKIWYVSKKRLRPDDVLHDVGVAGAGRLPVLLSEHPFTVLSAAPQP